MQPQNYTIVSGVGFADEPLVAFDNALQAAGIGDYNLVKVSSILPPACRCREEVDLPKGSILFTAYAALTLTGEETGETCVALAVPCDPALNGVIFEKSSRDGGLERTVRAMCEEGMQTRSRPYSEIKSTFAVIGKEKKKKYAAAISAVAMW